MSDFKNLPSGWRVVKLGDVCDFYKGKGISKDYISENGIFCIRYGELYTTYSEKIDKIYSKTNLNPSELFLSKCNDIIIPCSGETAQDIAKASCVLLDDIALGGDLNVLRTRQNGIFLSYYLNVIAKKDIAKIAQGVSIVHLYASELENLKILLPPLDEQEKIAEILSTWDEAINLTINLIENKKQFKKALMQNLLIAKIRFPEFQDEWRETKLGKILKERKTYQNKGFDLEHVSLTKDGVVPKSERYDRDFLVKDDNKQYKITKLNDICYNPANLKFGVICKNTYGNGIFSPIYVTFECCNELDNNFAGFYLTQNDFIQKVRKFEEGTVYERMAVSPGDFLRFKIKLPNLQEQQKIAEVLTACDDEINLLNLKLENLKKQKQGLMQKLLSGKAIVKVKGEKNVKMGY
jgi:type I site-specific deoxyribonuclease specificity subunit